MRALSFPAAFEPVRIEVGEFNGELHLPPAEPRPTTVRLLDGGVVDNIPVARAIQAAARVPASEAVRRWVVFLHPSPTLSDPEAHRTKGPDTPSVFNVLAGLAKGLGAETLLDDLEVLRRHNREAESQQIQRVTLCERALATLDPTVEEVLGEAIESVLGVPREPSRVNQSLGSADADCLYALLDNPGAFLQWVPIRSVPPASPIRDLDESQRYGIRSHFITELVNRPRSVRPFAQIIRLAFLTIEWIRWVEKLPEPKPSEPELAVMRCRAYDILLVAQLIDSALEQRVVTVGDDYLGTLEGALAAAETSGALSTLVGQLAVQTSGDSAKPLVERLQDPSRAVLEVLAAGLLPEHGRQATDQTSDALLLQLAEVCRTLARASAHHGGSTASIFTVLARANRSVPGSERISRRGLPADGRRRMRRPPPRSGCRHSPQLGLHPYLRCPFESVCGSWIRAGSTAEVQPHSPRRWSDRPDREALWQPACQLLGIRVPPLPCERLDVGADGFCGRTGRAAHSALSSAARRHP